MDKFTATSNGFARIVLAIALCGALGLSGCSGGAAGFTPDGVDFGGTGASHGHP